MSNHCIIGQMCPRTLKPVATACEYSRASTVVNAQTSVQTKTLVRPSQIIHDKSKLNDNAKPSDAFKAHLTDILEFHSAQWYSRQCIWGPPDHGKTRVS